MSIFTDKQRNNIVLASLILLGGVILYSLRELFNAFLGSILLYTLFKPVYNYLICKIGKIWSAVVVILSSFIIIVIPFFTLSYMVLNRLTDLKGNNFKVKGYISRLDDFVGSKFNQPHMVQKYVDKFSAFVQDLFPSMLTGALGIFLTVTVMYFILYFMLVQSESFEGNALRYAPMQKDQALQFASELRNTTYSNILGQGVIALVQGLLVVLCFFIVGINDAIFWGIISFFLAFMPVIGAPLITSPAAVILLLNGQTWQGIFVAAFTLVILVNIDNVIRFMINKKLADTHPIITVVGVIIGLPLFGFPGLVFGPLLLLWFIHLVKIYETNKVAVEQT
ncbi:AI-2E family transporter [Pelobium manganitolerans]|uniref:AI-2E family transporter n=1 Tax=Pelobium manganitolerans TaxID=1842495 RepID=A0A419S8I7_9SPHI|nr:AI-2E family transporter [Pelobium manganitolerans]RKD18214.1 AI-2E family transporter [Pelobium manganitolerans]